ncbi:MAG: hypothetical protein WAO98_10140 [Alphaproteobacteria bacterium]
MSSPLFRRELAVIDTIRPYLEAHPVIVTVSPIYNTHCFGARKHCHGISVRSGADEKRFFVISDEAVINADRAIEVSFVTRGGYQGLGHLMAGDFDSTKIEIPRGAEADIRLWAITFPRPDRLYMEDSAWTHAPRAEKLAELFRQYCGAISKPLAAVQPEGRARSSTPVLVS